MNDTRVTATGGLRRFWAERAARLISNGCNGSGAKPGKRRWLVSESQASQDADLAGSSFGGFVVSATSTGGFGSATAPIREPFLNWFR